MICINILTIVERFAKEGVSQVHTSGKLGFFLYVESSNKYSGSSLEKINRAGKKWG